MLTLTHLKAEHLSLGWVGEARLGLLTLGAGGALWLSLRLVLQARVGGLRRALGLACLALPTALMVMVWHTVFFVW
jgi:hypothetical protein